MYNTESTTITYIVFHYVSHAHDIDDIVFSCVIPSKRYEQNIDGCTY